MKKIVAKDLVKAYNKKTVLSHVNIEMQGGVYGLLGSVSWWMAFRITAARFCTEMRT